MKMLIRIVPWLAAAVSAYQIVATAILLREPYALPYLLIGTAFPLLVGVALFVISDDVLGTDAADPGRRLRRAGSWMLLACVPLWPTLLLQRLDLQYTHLGTMAFTIVAVGVALRHAHWDRLRWIVPLWIGCVAASLAHGAEHLMIGCLLVGCVLVLHAVAVMPQPPQPTPKETP